MQAMKHIMEGELELARAALESIPDADKPKSLDAIAAGAVTLSEMASAMRGNRAQRRAAARGTGRTHKPRHQHGA